MTTSTKTAPAGMRVFTIVWFGQLISQIGSGLTAFGLGVWLYQSTGLVMDYALVVLANKLPGILISPFAGTLVDRWDRRYAMILSDTGAALSTLGIALLLAFGQLQPWHIYIATALISIFQAIQSPAYIAATTLLVEEKDYGRVSGMVQMAEAIAQIVAPLLAGVLILSIKLPGLIVIDFATFLFAVVTTILVRFPKAPPSAAGAEAEGGSLLRDATYGWTFIATRPGLLALLLVFTAFNFLTGFVNVLIVPLILSFTTADILGLIITVSGAGLLLGSVIMSAWGGPKNRVYGVLGFMVLMGLSLAAMGIAPNPWIVGLASFGVLFNLPFVNGSSMPIWQSKVPPDVQGRVFSTLQMIAMSAMPVSILLAGPLADQVFNPLLVAGGAWATSVGALIGVGPGRGTAFIFIIMGVLTIVVSLLGYLNPRLRHLEAELPSNPPPPADEEAPAQA